MKMKIAGVSRKLESRSWRGGKKFLLSLFSIRHLIVFFETCIIKFFLIFFLQVFFMISFLELFLWFWEIHEFSQRFFQGFFPIFSTIFLQLSGTSPVVLRRISKDRKKEKDFDNSIFPFSCCFFVGVKRAALLLFI